MIKATLKGELFFLYSKGRIMYKWIAVEFLEVNCWEKNGLVCQLLAEPTQNFPYNSLSAAFHLYMIQAYVPKGYLQTPKSKHANEGN